MTDDHRHPHMSSDYAHGRRVPMTAPRVDVAPAPEQVAEHSMLPGKAYEEMTVAELRERATDRGIAYRGLNKAALVEALRA